MAGFITDFLPDYPEKHWECIEDVCSQVGGLTMLNACAWYSPERNETWFGGDWFECGIVKGKLTEAEVWERARTHSIWGKRTQAEGRRNAAHKASMKDIEARYKAEGEQVAYVRLRFPDGTKREVRGPIGLRKILIFLPQLRENIVLHHPKGTVLEKLHVVTVPSRNQFWSPEELLKVLPENLDTPVKPARKRRIK